MPMKFFKTTLFKIQLLLIWLVAFSVTSPSGFYAQVKNQAFHYLSPEEGLSQASNDYIFHDSKGFVWLSSIDGLNRFDGKSVKIYKSISGDSTSLLGNIITSNFYEDKQANLWFTTYEGIHCYIREKDRFQHIQIKNDKGEFLKENYHAFHLDKEDQLWVRVGIGETGMLYLFNIYTKAYTKICPIDGQYNFPIVDEKGDIKQVVSCIINGKKGITIYDTKAPFHNQTIFNGDPIDAAIDIIHLTTWKEENKEIWFLGSKSGLVIFYPETKKHFILKEYNQLDIGTVNSTLLINDTTLWVATSGQGILVFNTNTKKFTGQIPANNPEKLGLRVRTPNKLYKDHQENVWISSFSSGVNYTNLSKQKFDNLDEFIGQNISAIFETRRGELFCSYSGGRTAYYQTTEKEKKLTPQFLPTIKDKQSIQFFFEDNNDDLWAVSINQLLKWNATKLRFEYIQNLPNYILFVYQLKDGRTLFATYSGIYVCRIVDSEVIIAPFHSLGDYQNVLATSIYETKEKQLYLAVDAAKVLILSSKNDEYILTNQIEGIGYAKDYYEEEHSLWMATSTGILKVNKHDGTSHLLNEAENDAPNENYYCIIPDESGSLWLSCNRGVIRYFPKENKHHRFTLFDGLQAYEYNTNAFLKTRNGEIWLGGTKGINRFVPEKINYVSNSPKIQITRLQVNDELFDTEKQIGELKELKLDYFENTLSFDFVALEYSDPKNNQLQYQLENHEDNWVNADKNGFARYSNLPAGEYKFKIKASNADGIWSLQPYSISIFIKKPWWQTWWFYLLVLMAIIAIIYSILMYRLQQALKIERIRVKISSDLHDDVGSVLAGLTMQTEILAQTASKERQSKLNRISELSRNAMSRMRDTVWAIDARKDRFEDLLDRIREHANETLEWKDILFNLKITDMSVDKKLPTQIRQNLYLICKEAITNTAKHSNGDRLQIQFTKYKRTGIQLKIQDNGSVNKTKLKTSGLGLSNLQIRAKEMGANLEIDTDNGFLIQLTIL